MLAKRLIGFLYFISWVSVADKLFNVIAETYLWFILTTVCEEKWRRRAFNRSKIVYISTALQSIIWLEFFGNAIRLVLRVWEVRRKFWLWFIIQPIFGTDILRFKAVWKVSWVFYNTICKQGLCRSLIYHQWLSFDPNTTLWHIYFLLWFLSIIYIIMCQSRLSTFD